MLNKMDFIVLITTIINGGTVSDEDFDKMIQIFQCQRLIEGDYAKDEKLSQSQSILKIMEQNTLKFYQIYLGQ